MTRIHWARTVHTTVRVLNLSTRVCFANLTRQEWKVLNVGIEEFTTVRSLESVVFMDPDRFHTKTKMKAFLRQASIFNELGNSSGVASAAWDAVTASTNIENLQNDAILKLREESDAEKRLNKRHPDPEDISKIKYKDSSLQTRGVWNKLQVGKGSDGSPPSRKGFASVVWKGIVNFSIGFSP